MVGFWIFLKISIIKGWKFYDFFLQLVNKRELAGLFYPRPQAFPRSIKSFRGIATRALAFRHRESSVDPAQARRFFFLLFPLRRSPAHFRSVPSPAEIFMTLVSREVRIMRAARLPRCVTCGFLASKIFFREILLPAVILYFLKIFALAVFLFNFTRSAFNKVKFVFEKVNFDWMKMYHGRLFWQGQIDIFD